jgi:hypothetical protein
MSTGPEIYDAEARARMEAARQLEAKIQARAIQALQTNADFLANGSPTNAEVLAQVRVLTQEVSALIRLVLHRFDTDS